MTREMYKTKCQEFLNRAKTFALSEEKYNYFMQKALECALRYNNISYPTDNQLSLIITGQANKLSNIKAFELINSLLR